MGALIRPIIGTWPEGQAGGGREKTDDLEAMLGCSAALEIGNELRACGGGRLREPGSRTLVPVGYSRARALSLLCCCRGGCYFWPVVHRKEKYLGSVIARRA